jgi:hypothetical protein
MKGPHSKKRVPVAGRCESDGCDLNLAKIFSRQIAVISSSSSWYPPVAKFDIFGVILSATNYLWPMEVARTDLSVFKTSSGIMSLAFPKKSTSERSSGISAETIQRLGNNYRISNLVFLEKNKSTNESIKCNLSFSNHIARKSVF